MAGIYRVILESFPEARREHIERVVHKHNRKLDHHGFEALVTRVQEGTPSVIATYVEEHAAANVVAEVGYHGAKARIEAAEAA